MITLASVADTVQSISNTFGVDWPMLIAQSINFLIVALVIWKFAFSNILSTIKEREKQIERRKKRIEEERREKERRRMEEERRKKKERERQRRRVRREERRRTNFSANRRRVLK